MEKIKGTATATKTAGKGKGKAAVAVVEEKTLSVNRDWQEILQPLRAIFHILLQDDGIARSQKELAEAKANVGKVYADVTAELTQTKRTLPAKMARKALSLGLSLEGVKVNPKKVGAGN